MGNNWCGNAGPWHSVNGELVRGDPGCGVVRGRPNLGRSRGVHRRAADRSIDGACEIHADHSRRQVRWFADRLRHVRVCCGDWARVTGHSPNTYLGLTGVFLDPPYADTAGRGGGIYAVDSMRVAHDVREWAIEAGKDPFMRIVLAGYDGEHEMPGDWRVIEWRAQGGYGHTGNGRGKANRHRERLWCSPHCLLPSSTTIQS
jgi:hypothetical protein